MQEDLSKRNVRSFLSSRLSVMVNKLDMMISNNHYNDEDIYKEFTKLKNELVSDLRLLYNDDNIKLKFTYDISRNGISTIVCKPLNNFSYYLLNGHDYNTLKEMNISGNNLITDTSTHYEKLLNNHFRKHEL